MAKSKAEKKIVAPLTGIAKMVVILLRIVVGGTFVFSGFVKAIDPVGGAIKIEEYLNTFGLEALAPLALFFAAVLAAFEFVLGINIVCGSYRKISPRLAILFMAVMTPLTLYIALYNPVSDCGCFGDAFTISNWATFSKNAVLVLAIIALLRYNSRVRPLYNHGVQLFGVIYSLLFSLALSWMGMSHLPLLDFRPYKNGINIIDAMRVPENAPRNEYKTTVVYKKGDHICEFTLENYPANDTTWQFVETRNELIKAGYEPLIKDFSITDKEENDFTQEIIEHQGYTFLLLSSDLANADDSEINKINEIYDYSLEYNYPFYCISSASPIEIGNWVNNTGAEYPFYFMDAITIKTISRNNPTLMLLHNGTIMWKKGVSALPNEDILNESLELTPLGELLPYQPIHRLFYAILAFIGPMLLLLLTEKTVVLITRTVRKKIELKSKNNNQLKTNKP